MEIVLCKIVNRVSSVVQVKLNDKYVDKASRNVFFEFTDYVLEIHRELRELWFMGIEFKEVISIEEILKNDSYIFKCLIELIYPSNKLKYVLKKHGGNIPMLRVINGITLIENNTEMAKSRYVRISRGIYFSMFLSLFDNLNLS